MKSPSLIARTIWLALGVAVCLGCQSTRYRAATLPDDLRAESSSGSHQIQLSNLSTTAFRSTQLNPGDLLDVRVVSGLETEAPKPMVLQVSNRGEIDLPLVGPVRVAGLEPPDASRAIAAAAIERGVYRQPNITLEVRERATYEVTVLGAVKEPGVHKLPIDASDVLGAIAAAGGLTEEAGIEVEVMRQAKPTIFAEASPTGSGEIQQVGYTGPAGATGPTVQRINLAMASTDTAVQQPLGDRDVVMVPPKAKRVIHVSGLVNKPDQFELPNDQDVRVLDAIAMAGGQSSPVADKVFVIRQTAPGQTKLGEAKPAIIQVSIAKAKRNGDENLVLTTGDLVTVESTVATTVVDTIKDFFRVSMGLTSTAFAF